MSAKNKAPMPEQIIAWRMHPSKVNEDLHGGWAEAEDKREVSYTRTDYAQAQVAAAYEKAADAVEDIDGYDEIDGEHPMVTMIRDLTPTDAKASLDRLIAEAVKEALQVKPLVWEEKDGDWCAETPFGFIAVYYSQGFGWVFSEDEISPAFLKYPHELGEDNGFDTPKEAMESVNAQVARRILSALKGGEA